jgi:hypothetical protein
MDLELIRIRSRTLFSTAIAVVGLSLALVGGFNLLSTALASVDPVLHFYREINTGYSVVERQRGVVFIHNSDILLIALGTAVAYLGY